MLTVALPSLASGVVVGYLARKEATRLLDATIDRIFTLPRASPAKVKRVLASRP